MTRARRRWVGAAVGSALALIALSAALAPGAAAQGDVTSDHTITVNGEGEASAAPDVAYVTVGVQTQNASAAAAVAENSRRMSAVLDAMRGRGLGSRDLQTSGLNVSPQFDREQQVTGYQATNNVTITVHEVDRAGELLDAALAAGANRIGGLRFGISDTAALHEQALADAMRVARGRADALAGAMGLRIVGVVSVTETSVAVPQPRAAVAYAASAPGPGAAPPVESGELQVRTQVRAAFRFEP
ncbi:MAG TPA: SIMPL domain-containing protein [Chloroflexota bacterium]|nr:SIMPL domain-containing protein [Chloroflexota bacterium]